MRAAGVAWPGMVVAMLTALLCACGSAPTPAASGANALGAGASATPASAGNLSDAAATVSTFLDALRARNCAGAFALLADPLRATVKSADGLCATQPAPPAYTVSDPVALTATSAFATVRLGSGAQQTLETVTVLYRAPHWYVSGLVANGSTKPTAGASASPGAGIAATIAQQYAAQNSGAVATVSCPPPPAGGYAPGSQFQCTFSDSTGRTGTMTVTIGSSSGAFTWTSP